MADISKITLPDGNTYNIKDISSGYITGMTILSYGGSTWDDFITAYSAKKVVYCRASSNSNPATGSQTRMAFMAYVNNGDNPTNVEFQYYRSVSSHTDATQGDQVFIYKLDKSSGWSVTTRNAFTKVDTEKGLTDSYTAGTSAVIKIKANLRSETALTNDSAAATEVANRVYPVALDKSGYLAVNVPWESGSASSLTDQEVDDAVNAAFPYTITLNTQPTWGGVCISTDASGTNVVTEATPGDTLYIINQSVAYSYTISSSPDIGVSSLSLNSYQTFTMPSSNLTITITSASGGGGND